VGICDGLSIDADSESLVSVAVATVELVGIEVGSTDGRGVAGGSGVSVGGTVAGGI
jgi:hypothetical protein